MTQNPLLARIKIPGETYRLPSQGVFYTNGELDESVHNGEVEVYPMTAIDEITLSTPDKLLSGKAILEILGRCVPQIKKPECLLAKDVDFLMVCLRLVTFGSIADITYKHTCSDAIPHTYNIDMQQFITKSRELDPTKLATQFQLHLENGQQVQLKPLSYVDVLELYRVTAMTKTSELSSEEAETLIVNALTGVVKSVDDVTDVSQIKEWISAIPLGWKRQIEAMAQHNGEWGVDLVAPEICLDCGEPISILISANPVSFFS